MNRKVMIQSSSNESHKRVVSDQLGINCDRVERDAGDNIFFNQFEDRKHYEYFHSRNSIDN